jgi:DNA repair exonuclease SbcCD ATPase subunit
MPRLAFHFLALALVALVGALLADPGERLASGQSAGADKRDLPKNKQLLAVTPEREAAVMTFVQRNHPELAELLTHLKVNQPREYERAIRDLHRVTERLAGVQERDLVLYELEAKAWTAQSRIQLLAARLRMGENEALRKELREALGAQVDAKLAVLKHQRSQTAERLAKMDSEISRLENSREQVIDKQLQTLRDSIPAKTASKNSGNKTPAAGEKRPASVSNTAP